MKEIPNNPHEINSQPSTDAVMLQMMAQENMEEMEGSPIWAMEIVKAAFNFLKEGGNLQPAGELQYLEGILDVIASNDRLIIERQNQLRALASGVKDITSQKEKLLTEISELEKLPGQYDLVQGQLTDAQGKLDSMEKLISERDGVAGELEQKINNLQAKFEKLSSLAKEVN